MPGLVETSDLIDQEGTVEVPGFNRKVDIKDGVKKVEPLDVVYKIQKDTNTLQYFYDWYRNNEDHDVTIINTDGTGVEVDRWLWADCEVTRFSERTFNAAGIEFYGLSAQIICNSTPVRVQA